MVMSKRVRLSAVMFGVTVGVLFVAERLRPLRRWRDPTPTRVPRNVVIAALAAATTLASEAPIVRPVQQFAERRRFGLLRMLPLPRAVRAALGFLLLDYTLYVWHRLNHRSPLLWRFHAVHHVDLDLDTTTGIRFHFGELALSAGFRTAQLLLIGVDRRTLQVWQQALITSVVFHHSNVALPAGAERALQTVLVTPRMHGIHHSTRRDELNTNFSSLLSVWDRLHRTFLRDVPPDAITVGVDGFLDPRDVTLERSLTLPFRPERRLLPATRPTDSANA